MLIGGEWRQAASSEEIDVVNPATEEVVGSVPSAAAADVELAVATAKRAFPEWAATHAVDGRDTGIDAVAKIRGEDSYCAIQCKFYREGYRVQKADIDSFFTASGKRQFSRRLIIDTTDAPWSANAEAALGEQDKPASRIGLDRRF